MKNYKVTGKSRNVGAIGAFENFIEIVEADTEESAREEARAAQTEKGRDHIQTQVCKPVEVHYWVTMTDKFMSGWGKAEGRINKLVVSCENYRQASIVEENALARSEMKHVNICFNNPVTRYNRQGHKVSYHGKHDGSYESWFTRGYFSAQ